MHRTADNNITTVARRIPPWPVLVTVILLLGGCSRCKESEKTAAVTSDAQAAPPANPPAPKERYRGRLGRIDENVIVGWAWDSTKPNAAIAVDIYDGPTLIKDKVPADIARGNLEKTLPDPNHGFALPLPETL